MPERVVKREREIKFAKLFLMLDELKKLGFETAIYGISNVLIRLLNFFLVPLYTHYLLPDDYGRVASVFSLIAFLDLFYLLGLNQGYMRFKSEENLSYIFSFLILWAFFLSIFVIGFSDLFARIIGLEGEYIRLIRYGAFIVYLDSICSIPLVDLRMEHKAFLFVVIRALSIILNLILNIVFLKYLRLGIDGIFYASIISSLSQFLLLKDYLRYFRLSFKISSMKEIFSYSLPYLPASLSSVAVQLLDRPLMMHFLSPYYVGLYQANFRLAVFLNLVVSMFDFAWRPFVIERMKREDAKEIFRKVFDYFVFFINYIFLILALFIKDIVMIPIGRGYLINPNYWSGVDIVPIVMCGYIFWGLYTFFMVGSIITKKTTYSMKANILASLTSVLLNLILIPRYGIYGAAFSFVFANVALAGYMYMVNEKILWPVGYRVWRFFILFILTLIASYLLNRLSISACFNLQLRFFVVLIYPFILVAFGYFDKADINILRERIKRYLF